jgi:outer membrane cobalamin receptor
MKRLFNTTILLLTATTFWAQTTINGKVFDPKGEPIIGVNVYIDGSYDGTVTDENGIFAFKTTESGQKTLIASFLTYETFKKIGEISSFVNLEIKLRESVTSLDAVVITAGSFEAGEKARISVLKPLDIVTTAGNAGNIIAALNTLPGTQNVGEDGRLFVRGGEANETQTFVDGIRVPQPYGPAPNNTPTRSRFSPFLFSGISFSTGGYSAEYGEALSSVLSLNTINEPQQNQTDIQLMTVGGGLGKTHKGDKQSLTYNLSYINLGPYQKIVPQKLDWNKPIQSMGGEVVYRYKLKNGLLKAYSAFDRSTMDINEENIGNSGKTRIALENSNVYGNVSYKGNLTEKVFIHTGVSYGLGKNDLGISLDNLNNTEKAIHAKVKLTRSVSDRVSVYGGVDYFFTDFTETYKFNQGETFPFGYKNNITAGYGETDIFLSKNLAFKAGARVSHNILLDEVNLNPRASMAYKVNSSSQFSLAYGDFNQTPNPDIIKHNTPNLSSEKASHYILNYQYNKNRRLFRSEIYLKDYSNLVKYNTSRPQYNSTFDNNGSGYARGLDIFWRDSKTFKNTDYWVSYSYIDSERNYHNFPTSATPSFVAKNSLSIVTKHFIEDLKSQIGFAYMTSSGRPYNNPNEKTFMNGKTKAFQDLSFNWAYLMSQQKIVYFSISNIFGTDNVFGYRYAQNPDNTGQYQRRAITQPASRFIFLGFFWTISADQNKNQLDNL